METKYYIGQNVMVFMSYKGKNHLIPATIKDCTVRMSDQNIAYTVEYHGVGFDPKDYKPVSLCAVFEPNVFADIEDFKERMYQSTEIYHDCNDMSDLFTDSLTSEID